MSSFNASAKIPRPAGALTRSLCALGLSLCFIAAACEEAPLPTPAGAVFVDLRDNPSADCNLNTHDVRIGTVGNSGEVTLEKASTEVEVTCSVVAAGGGFDINATVDEAPFVEITVKGFSKDNNSEDAAAEGTLSYASSDTGGDIFSSNACKFWLNSEDQKVAAGAVWLTFACPAVTSEGNACEIAKSYLAVENCTGAVTEEEE